MFELVWPETMRFLSLSDLKNAFVELSHLKITYHIGTPGFLIHGWHAQIGHGFFNTWDF